MTWPFSLKCAHPFAMLIVQKEQTVVAIDEDFERVEYYFECTKCGEHLVKKHAKTIGGVTAFMKRHVIEQEELNEKL